MDCWTLHYSPRAGLSSILLLETKAWSSIADTQKTCCLKPRAERTMKGRVLHHYWSSVRATMFRKGPQMQRSLRIPICLSLSWVRENPTTIWADLVWLFVESHSPKAASPISTAPLLRSHSHESVWENMPSKVGCLEWEPITKSPQALAIKVPSCLGLTHASFYPSTAPLC